MKSAKASRYFWTHYWGKSRSKSDPNTNTSSERIKSHLLSKGTRKNSVLIFRRKSTNGWLPSLQRVRCIIPLRFSLTPPHSHPALAYSLVLVLTHALQGSLSISMRKRTSWSPTSTFIVSSERRCAKNMPLISRNSMMSLKGRVSTAVLCCIVLCCVVLYWRLSY